MLRTLLFSLPLIIALAVFSQWDRLALVTKIIDRYGISAPIGFAASRWFWESARNIEFQALATAGGYNTFLRRHLLKGDERKWAQIHSRLNQHYQEQSARLAEEWGMEQNLTHATFMVTAVANMWRVGQAGQAEASVRQFFLSGGGKGVTTPVWAYVASPFADCNDFATMLYMMLRLSGFQPHHVGTTDHIYLEVTIDGQPYIMDAMYGFIFQGDHQAFLNHGLRRANYYLVELAAGNPASPTYRPNWSALRMQYLLARGRIDHRLPKDYSHWDRFDTWLALNAIGDPYMN